MLKLNNVSKYYYNKGVITSGLTKANLELELGEFVVITGESGSGKSTLLNVLSCMDTYEDGEMYIEGKETSHYGEEDFENYRRKYIANIFQEYNLINSYTVYQNVEVALQINGYNKKDMNGNILEILEKVGLLEYAKTKVSKLSGGQKQRVAIARALAKGTDIIIADEPTGNLDSKSAEEVCKLLQMAKEKLVIVVTHNFDQFEPYATRRIKMSDGRIIEDAMIANPHSEALIAREKSKKKTELQEESNEGEKEKIKNNITFGSVLRLGLRNTTNIFAKFLLIITVLSFLVYSFGSQYANLKQSEVEMENYGYNYLFNGYSNDRIVLSKADGTSFTDEDILSLEKTQNIKNVVKEDILIDGWSYLEQTNYNSGIFLSNVENFQGELEYGRMPENSKEIILRESESNLSYYSDDVENFLMQDATINFNGASNVTGFKIVGIDVTEELKRYDAEVFIAQNYIERFTALAMLNYSTTTFDIEDKTFTTEETGGRKPYPLDTIEPGEVIVYEELESLLDTWDITRENLTLHTENIYASQSKEFDIVDTFDDENYHSVLGITEQQYQETYSNIYMNTTDFMKLYAGSVQQISVYVNDVYSIDETISSIEAMGYNTFPLIDTISENAIEATVMKIIQVPLITLALVGIFFICYFVLSLVLKSRTKYFATIRMLGMNEKNSKRILDIELLIDAHIVYGIFLGIILMLKQGIITMEFFAELAYFLGAFELSILYIIVMSTVYIASRRINNKIFAQSAMSAYREEV